MLEYQKHTSYLILLLISKLSDEVMYSLPPFNHDEPQCVRVKILAMVHDEWIRNFVDE